MSLTLHQRMALAAVVATPGVSTADVAERVGREVEATYRTLRTLALTGMPGLVAQRDGRWHPSALACDLVARQLQRAGGAS